MAEGTKENKVLNVIKGALPSSKKQIIGTSVVGILSAGIGFVAGRISKKGAKKAPAAK